MAAPDIIAYPTKEIRAQLSSEAWEQVTVGWIALLRYYIKQETYPQSLHDFLTAYVRNCANKFEGNRNEKETELRSIVFYLITAKKAVYALPSTELVWDFITLYGSTNVQQVTTFILDLQKHGSPMIIQKLSKLSLYYIENNGVDSFEVLQTLATVFSSSELRQLWATEKWISELTAIDNDLSIRVNYILRKSTIPGKPELNSEGVTMILDLFPQLSYRQVEKLLPKYGNNVELLTVYLLENPDALDNIPSESVTVPEKFADEELPKETKKEKIIFGKKKATELGKMSEKNLETTLRLIYDANEDERDDTYDDAEANNEDEPASSAAIDKIERFLWETYSKNPGVFQQSARKGAQRREIKNKTDWSDEQIEGWARMLERNPRRKELMAEKYMFQGNIPHPGPRVLQNRQVNDENGGSEAESSEKLPLSGTEQGDVENDEGKSVDKSRSSQTQKRDNRRKEQNKARHGNHNRKAGHSRKMKKMGAGPS